MAKHVEIIPKPKWRQKFCRHKWTPTLKGTPLWGQAIHYRRCTKCGKWMEVYRVEIKGGDN